MLVMIKKRLLPPAPQVMDCIACQKCKLHGKLQLLGIGTALKILLVPEPQIATSLAREELVALLNTLGKFSHAISAVESLSHAFWAEHGQVRGRVIRLREPTF
eukprot:48558-Prorocentrum_minimum.AAC.1